MTLVLLIMGSAFIAFGVTLVAFIGYAFPSRDRLEPGEADKFLAVGGNATIRYRIVDKGGPYVLFLHSFGASLDMWEKVVAHLATGRCVALDMPGQGLSAGSVTGRYDLESQRRTVITLMDSLGIGQAILVGCSMGASVAAWTGARSPERVSDLLLAAPSALPGTMHHKWPMDYVYRPGTINAVFRAIAATKVIARLFPKSLAVQSLDVTGSYNADYADALATIRQNAVIVWSKGDKRVPFSASQLYMRAIPFARLVEAAPQSGHNVPMAEPGLVAGLISDLEDALQDTSSSPAAKVR